MKAVILNAGSGERLSPITKCISKGLVPVYDRPALLYHLAFLARLGVHELAVVVSPQQEQAYRDFLGQIDTQGLAVSLYVQNKGRGVLSAYVSCADFTQGNNIILLLGDCLHFIDDISHIKQQAEACFEQDKFGMVVGEEKHGKTGVGLYFVPRSLSGTLDGFMQFNFTQTDDDDFFDRLQETGRLMLPRLLPGDEWFDIGTAEQLFLASAYVREKQTSLPQSAEKRHNPPLPRSY